MTPEGLDELRHIVELQEFYTSRNDPAHIKEMDDQFHNLICTISGRQVIADTLRPAASENPELPPQLHGRHDPRPAATQEHRAIFEAMAAGDASEQGADGRAHHQCKSEYSRKGTGIMGYTIAQKIIKAHLRSAK